MEIKIGCGIPREIFPEVASDYFYFEPVPVDISVIFLADNPSYIIALFNC